MLTFDLKDRYLEEKNFSESFVQRSIRQSDFETEITTENEDYLTN